MWCNIFKISSSCFSRCRKITSISLVSPAFDPKPAPAALFPALQIKARHDQRHREIEVSSEIRGNGTKAEEGSKPYAAEAWILQRNHIADLFPGNLYPGAALISKIHYFRP
jgi:hypothetical protein